MDVLGCACAATAAAQSAASLGRDSPVWFPRVEMPSTNPSKSLKNVCDAKRVFQHYEKLEVEDSLSLDEAVESFEVFYKKSS